MNQNEIIEKLKELEHEALHGSNFLAKAKNKIGGKNSFKSIEQLNLFYQEYIKFRKTIFDSINNIPQNYVRGKCCNSRRGNK